MRAGADVEESADPESGAVDTPPEDTGVPRFSSFDVGADCICGTTLDGTLRCSGLQPTERQINDTYSELEDWWVDHGQLDPPEGTWSEVSVSEGDWDPWGGSEAAADISDLQYGACAIGADGDAACWGQPFDTPGEFPEWLEPPSEALTTASMGFRHACGLTATGEVRCWGACENGSCDAPSGSYVAIESGHDMSCALDAAGSIACWGLDPDIAADDAETLSESVADWGANGPYVDILSMWNVVCGLLDDGTLRCHEYYVATVSEWGPAAAGAKSVAIADSGQVITGVCWLDVAGSVTCGNDLAPDDQLPSSWPELRAHQLTTLASSGGELCGLTTDNELVCASHWPENYPCPFCAAVYVDE